MKTFQQVVAEARIAYLAGTINRDIQRIAAVPTEMSAQELLDIITYINHNQGDTVLHMVLEEQGAFHGFKLVYLSDWECYTLVPIQYYR